MQWGSPRMVVPAVQKAPKSTLVQVQLTSNILVFSRKQYLISFYLFVVVFSLDLLVCNELDCPRINLLWLLKLVFAGDELSVLFSALAVRLAD